MASRPGVYASFVSPHGVFPKARAGATAPGESAVGYGDPRCGHVSNGFPCGELAAFATVEGPRCAACRTFFGIDLGPARRTPDPPVRAPVTATLTMPDGTTQEVMVTSVNIETSFVDSPIAGTNSMRFRGLREVEIRGYLP